jgi:regulatory protein
MQFPGEDQLPDGPRKRYPEEIVWQKICAWCAFQERSQQEVRDKLFAYGLSPAKVEEMIVRLLSDNFLSEQRFAIAFAGGKFRQLGWGRIRIRSALKLKKVSDACIRIALSSIDEDEYRKRLKQIIRKRGSAEKEKDPRKLRWKLGAYAISRGFESGLVSEVLGESEEDD